MGEDVLTRSLCIDPQQIRRVPKLPPGWTWSPARLCDAASDLGLRRPVISNGCEKGCILKGCQWVGSHVSEGTLQGPVTHIPLNNLPPGFDL